MGIRVYPPATANFIPSVANSTARLALTGIEFGYQVRQLDNGFIYQFIGAAGTESDAASWYRIPVIQTAVLQADFPKTNNTLTAVTGLTLNLTTGHWYRVNFTFYASYGGAAISIGDFNGGLATATAVKGYQSGENYSGDPFISIVPLTALDTGLAYAGGDDGVIYGEFTIQVNAGGTLIPRFAINIGSGAANNLQKYSTITAQDVTP